MIGKTNAISRLREYKKISGTIKGTDTTNLTITGIPFTPKGCVVECATQNAGYDDGEVSQGRVISPFFTAGSYDGSGYVESGVCTSYAKSVDAVDYGKLDSYFSGGTLTIPTYKHNTTITTIWDSSYSYNYVIYGY